MKTTRTQRKAEMEAHRARMAQIHAENAAIVATGKCPDCGAGLHRNNSLGGGLSRRGEMARAKWQESESQIRARLNKARKVAEKALALAKKHRDQPAWRHLALNLYFRKTQDIRADEERLKALRG